MSAPKLSDGQTAEIARLREERGWSHRRIATRFGVSTGAIQYHCLKLGAVSPRTRANRSRGPMTMVGRDGRLQRRFTEAEDDLLLKLSLANMPLRDIAIEMKRPRTSVRLRLFTLAMREDGQAGIAHPTEAATGLQVAA
ncbi:hypothetical protein KOAAANKH_00132 [Brevundimonas sp. NIBR10]|uniref:hypothetical protein n=1 Tax=Brevundimonas sp. NIBR10 TaxID=3015997 RepID=UPI0022F1AE3A|nr:hypothetical protein [Brevundimonas sp. NIBR10]WGM45271.1 hypothetical protein KOAAANKH_00132 [Brevundimonas sp. NIBR10]